MEIVDIIQTCRACPSQWEAKTKDGNGVYIRYRWGGLAIWVSNNPGEHGLDGEQVFYDDIGDEYDGVLSWSKVAPIIEKL